MPTLQRVIQPFRPQRRIVANEQSHRLLQPLQVVAARAREAFPVFEESLGVVARPGRQRPLTAGGLFQGHQSATNLQLFFLRNLLVVPFQILPLFVQFL